MKLPAPILAAFLVERNREYVLRLNYDAVARASGGGYKFAATNREFLLNLRPTAGLPERLAAWGRAVASIDEVRRYADEDVAHSRAE